MKRTLLLSLTLCLLLPLTVLAQTSPSQSYIPSPYGAVGISLMPNGYSPVAVRGQVGLMENAPHFVFDGYAAIDNGKKSNDGTLNNIKGHDDYIHGFLGYRQGDWYFGGGMAWSQLVTSNYTKGTNFFSAVRQGDIRYQFGGGKDWYYNDQWKFSYRVQVLYLLPPQHESVAYPAAPGQPSYVCQGCGNGVQGPELTLQMPSPADSRHHWFVRYTLGVYEFHTTITEPSNLPLTAEQDSSRHAMGTFDALVGYRF